MDETLVELAEEWVIKTTEIVISAGIKQIRGILSHTIIKTIIIVPDSNLPSKLVRGAYAS